MKAEVSLESRTEERRPLAVDWDRTANAAALAGRFLVAIPMLVYPVLHFVYTDFVASIVPPWIPWHYFWTYFTAVTIMAAGVAIVLNKRVRVPATLLGIEILLFVLLIHVPLIFHGVGDPWAERAIFGDLPGRLNNAFKDLGLCAAAFLVAGTQPPAWRVSARDGVLTLGRAILVVCTAAFGILHFVYPAFAPGIPPMSTSVVFPVPGHLFWVYLTAAGFLAAAAGLAVNWRARHAAILLGAMILFFDLLTWGPVFVRHPMELTGNWLKDIGTAGGAWVLAACLPREGKPFG